MNQEQENELFKSIGSIEATQKAMLDAMLDLKTDIHKSIKDVNTRVDKTESRLDTVENKVTNLRIKVAAAGGAGGLTVLMIAELIKLKTGGL